MLIKYKIIYCCFFVFIFFGCDGKQINKPVVIKDPGFSDIAFPQDPPDPPEYLNITEGDEERIWKGDEQYLCTETIYDQAIAPSDYPIFDPNAEVIWPGSLVQGNSISSPTPERIPLARGSGGIVIDLLNGSKGVQKKINEVSISKIFEAANEIIAQNTGIVPARFDFSAIRIRKNSELSIRMKANASFLGIGVGSSFAFDENEEYNRFIVEVKQSFYTLIFERPAEIFQFFSSNVDTSDFLKFMGPGNPPAYISSITYGRIFYLLVESTDESSMIEASINAGFLGFGVNGNTKEVKNLSDLNIKCFAIGGDANQAIAAIKKSNSNIATFLSEGEFLKVGKPLSYTIRSLATDKVLKNGVATTYSIKNCAIVGRQKEVEIYKSKLGPYYPDHTKGDREFGGHGPRVTASMILSINSAKDKINLKLTLQAKETKEDWTTGIGGWEQVVYSAPSGWQISKITTASSNTFTYTDDDHLYDYGPGNYWDLYQGYFKIMGDTGGNDVGNITSDDTHLYYINLKFKVMLTTSM